MLRECLGVQSDPMRSRFRPRPIWALVAYAVLDTACAGMGMGVPFFCILLGFPAGWAIARLAIREKADLHPLLRRVLRYALFCCFVTFVLMAAIWGWAVSMLFDPGADLANFGIPMILFEPKASFIGWLALMILVSPVLQLLAMVFASCVALAARPEQPQ